MKAQICRSILSLTLALAIPQNSFAQQSAPSIPAVEVYRNWMKSPINAPPILYDQAARKMISTAGQNPAQDTKNYIDYTNEEIQNLNTKREATRQGIENTYQQNKLLSS